MALRTTAGRLRLSLTTVAVQVLPDAGAAATLTPAAAGGNQVANNGHVEINIANGGGGAVTVTFKAQKTCSQGFLHDRVVTVPNDGITRRFGPFDPGRFNDPSGNMFIGYSAVATVTVGAVQI
jgi:hypothetical protein